MKTKHALRVKNDFGTVVWDETHEEAFNLMREAAWALQMTDGEFMEMMSETDRVCPKCRQGKH